MERTTPHHPIQQHLGLTPSNTICPITRLFWVPVVNKRGVFVALVLNKRGGKRGIRASCSFAIPEIREGGNSRKVTDGAAEEPNLPEPRVG